MCFREVDQGRLGGAIGQALRQAPVARHAAHQADVPRPACQRLGQKVWQHGIEHVQRAHVIDLHVAQHVGKVRNGTFTRKVKASGQLRKPPAWSLWEGLIGALEAVGVRYVELDQEDGVTWLAPLALFRSMGIRIDRGAGPQLALPLEHWARVEVRAAGPEDVAAMLAGLGGVP